MKNKVLRIFGCNNYTMEFFCAVTNDLNPYRELREGGIVVFRKDEQINFDLDEEELTELIEFLTEMRNSVSKFNKESKPKSEE